MISKAALATNGRSGRSNTDKAKLGNQAARGWNIPPRNQGCSLANMNARTNASNHGNPSPSHGDNAENARVNGGANNRINQIAVVVAQMAAMLTQANGMPIPHAMQQLGVEIPHLELSH